MEVDLLFMAYWILMPVIWHLMLKSASIDLLRMSIPSYLIAMMYLFQYLGLPILYFKLDPHRSHMVTDPYLVLQVFVYSSLTITLMVFGFIIARGHFGDLRWEGEGTRGGVRFVPGSPRMLLGLMVLVLIGSAVLYQYLSVVGFNRVAVFVALGFSENNISAEVARSAMGNAFEGKHHWYRIFMKDMVVFAAMALFAQFLLRRTWQNGLMMISSMLIAVFSLVADIQKGPLAFFLVSLAIVYFYVKTNARIYIKSFVYVFVLLAVTVSLMLILFMGSRSYGESYLMIYRRTLTGQLQPAYHYLEYIPAQREFLWGRTLPNPGGLLPFENVNLSKEICSWYFPRADKVIGSMPSVYWCDMYANFGLYGILIPPFFVGYLLYALNILLYRLKPSPLSVALIVWLIVFYGNLSGTSLGNFIISLDMMAVAGAFIAISVLAYGRIDLVRRHVRGRFSRFQQASNPGRRYLSYDVPGTNG